MSAAHLAAFGVWAFGLPLQDIAAATFGSLTMLIVVIVIVRHFGNRT